MITVAFDKALLMEFLRGTSVLLALCLLQWVLARRYSMSSQAGQVASGLLFGVIAVIGMAAPVALAPGIIFDARSVVISAAALFGGPFAAAGAVIPSALFRVFVGGPGMAAGVVGIGAAALIGLGFHWLGFGGRKRVPWAYVAMGLCVNAMAVATFYLLPEPARSRALSDLAPSLVTILTLATPALCLLLFEIFNSLKTEEKLKEKDTRIAGMLAALPDVLMVVDEDGHRLEAHTGSRHPLAGLCQRASGNALAASMPGGSAEQPLAAIATAIRTQRLQEMTFRLETDDWQGWVEARAVPIGLVANGRRGAMLLVRDITKVVSTQEQLVAARDDAQKANRVKNLFLANMSHELRTPLNAIMGFADMIRMEVLGGIGNADYRQYADDIHTSGTLLTSLIDDVLDISKIEAGQYKIDAQPVPAADLIGTSVKLLAVRAGKRDQRLIVDAPPDGAILNVDRRAIVQVLNNVIGNAIEYTPNGGRMAVSTDRSGSGGIAIRVVDSGVGIAPEALAKVLEPFHQHHEGLSRTDKGTGLGLYISRRLIELHGGQVSIDSLVGVGTVVTVSLPAERITAWGATVLAQEADRGQPAVAIAASRGTTGTRETDRAEVAQLVSYAAD